MSRLNFLMKYADPDQHYDQAKELKAYINDPKFTYPESKLQSSILRHDTATTDMLVDHMMTGNPSFHMKKAFFGSFGSDMSSEHISKLLEHPNAVIASEVAEHCKTPENVEQALRRSRTNQTGHDISVGRNAIISKASTSDQIGKAMRDETLPLSVRAAAIRTIRTRPEDLAWAADVSNHHSQHMADSAKAQIAWSKDFDEMASLMK